MRQVDLKKEGFCPVFKGPAYVIKRRDKAYPKCLRTIPSPPSELYCIGNIELLHTECFSIVGARKSTPYGVSCAKHFGKLASEAGLTIVSGGATGCDSASHIGALANNGKTIVFLGGGCNRPYPARNVRLFQKIIDSGGLIASEQDWDYDALPYTFRSRNRLIAGMSKVTFVVEAGIPSGTFSTADEALDAQREVWAVPGSIMFSGSAGSNRLIYQGATPIIDDVVFEMAISQTYKTKVSVTKNLNYFKKVKEGEKIGESDNPVLQAILAQPMSLEELYQLALEYCGKEEPNVWLSKRLVEAEATKQITKYSDGRYGGILVT